MSSPAFIPYLAVKDADEALRFYTEVMGMQERLRLAMPDGSVAHAELAFGGGLLFVSSEFPSMGVVAPAGSGTAVSLALEVADVDAVVERMRAAGATVESEPEDQFHGARSAKVHDPFGHRWLLNQELEQVSSEEVKRRFDAMMSGDSA